MRYVQVAATKGGTPENFLDPDPYLRKLPDIQAQLPVGARVFAMDPDHYDFSGPRCVKDLHVGSLMLREGGEAKLVVELFLEPNRFKHNSGLIIRYNNVTNISVDVNKLSPRKKIWPESRRLGDLQLDEILPIADGCSHEIKFTGGSMVIACEDLHAEWMA